MKETYKKQDPLTGRIFLTTKANKRFECKANRIAFNRKKILKEKESLRPIDRILHQNHQILKELLFNRRGIIVRRPHLISLGYNFSYFTNYAVNNEGISVPCIYEFKLEQLFNGNYMISRLVYHI